MYNKTNTIIQKGKKYEKKQKSILGRTKYYRRTCISQTCAIFPKKMKSRINQRKKSKFTHYKDQTQQDDRH